MGYVTGLSTTVHSHVCWVDKIHSTFPWYKYLNNLMGTNPIVDTSALAHSTSLLNLSVLVNGQSLQNEVQLDDKVG